MRKLFSGIIIALLLASMFVAAFTVRPAKATDVNSWPMFRNDLMHSGATSSLPILLEPLWSYPTGGPVFSSPAVVGGVVYVGSYDGKVYALNTTRGTQLWSYQTGGAFPLGALNWSSPAVVDGVVYVGSLDGKVYALDATTGASIWNYTTGGGVFSSPAVSGGILYVGSDDGKVYAWSTTTHAQLWNHTTGYYVYSSPAVVGGVVYVGSGDGNVYALDAATGTQDWSFPTGGGVFSSPAVGAGVVYVGSYDHTVYALDAGGILGGRLASSYTTGGEVFSSPAVAGGVVYVGSDDGHVYAYSSTIIVPDDYPTIQEAVDHAPPGGTVFVRSGDYVENVIVDKPLSLVGQNQDDTYVGNPAIALPAISIEANNVSVTGFCVSDNHVNNGISLIGVTGCFIFGNTLAANYYGISLQNSGANTISRNLITINQIGINFDHSTHNNVYGNDIQYERVWGMALDPGSVFNVIYNNNFEYNNLTVDRTVFVPFGATNVWDGGYPVGGNYWGGTRGYPGGFVGTDSNNGPGQNVPGSDGISDAPLVVCPPWTDVDRYPLMGPWGSTTNPGTNVPVILDEEGSRLIFDHVTSPGETSITTTNVAPALPSGFSLATQPPTYYDIQTSAGYTGKIEVMLHYDDTGMTQNQEADLELRQYDPPTQLWIDITTSVDVDSNIIYGEANHLSTFAIVARTSPSPAAPVGGYSYQITGNGTGLMAAHLTLITALALTLVVVKRRTRKT